MAHSAREKTSCQQPDLACRAPFCDQQAPSWLGGRRKHHMKSSTHTNSTPPPSACLNAVCTAASPTQALFISRRTGGLVRPAQQFRKGVLQTTCLVQVDAPPRACIDAGVSARAGSGGAASCNFGTAERGAADNCHSQAVQMQQGLHKEVRRKQTTAASTAGRHLARRAP
jgi:hypothetical protein